MDNTQPVDNATAAPTDNGATGSESDVAHVASQPSPTDTVDASAAPADHVPPAAPTTTDETRGSVHEGAGATTTNGK
jgi:hypothetical protein